MNERFALRNTGRSVSVLLRTSSETISKEQEGLRSQVLASLRDRAARVRLRAVAVGPSEPSASGLAKAPADGYTIGVTLGDSLINNVATIKALGYDPRTDFAFITQAVRSPAILSANADLGVKNMDDFRKLVASKSHNLSYGTWGPGGLGHLAGEALNRTLKADMVHVPQRGEAPVMADLLSKTVSIGLTSAGLARPQVRAGKVQPLAIMGRERSRAARSPDDARTGV